MRNPLSILLRLDLHDVRVRLQIRPLITGRACINKLLDHHIFEPYCTRTSAQLTSPTPTLRLTKQVPREFGGLPPALAANHRLTTRLAKHATAHPLPYREQYLQCARCKQRRRSTAWLRRIGHCLGTDTARRKDELGEPARAVHPPLTIPVRVLGARTIPTGEGMYPAAAG
jgi:hypothetical protein